MTTPMEKRTLGKTGMKVTTLGFGASEMGHGGMPLRAAAQLLNRALDAGLNLIDTAECYGNAEDTIGQAIGHRRQEYYLITKCGHLNGFPGDWSGAALQHSIENSLRRLRTDVLDGVLLHSCDLPVLQRGEAVAALAQAKAQGKVRFIGYSGDGEEARWAVDSGVFDLLEISVSIADQEAIETVLPQAAARGLGVIAKRPLANAAWVHQAAPANHYHRPYWERLRQLDYDFIHGPTAQIGATALRFTLSVPGVHTAIVGSTRPERWQQNAELLAAGPLPRAEYDAIRSRWHERAGSDWFGQR